MCSVASPELMFNKKGCDHQVLQDNVLVEQVVKRHTSDPHTAGLDLLAIFSSSQVSNCWAI